MHTPCCTVEQRCLRCDAVRAQREINRLREVLRTTMDALLDAHEEIKDLNAKIARLCAENAQQSITITFLHNRIDLVQKGKISAAAMLSPSAKSLSDPAAGEPKTPMQGIFC